MLNILCGFSVGEVAGAFVSTHSAIEKRISRAKRVLASSKKLFDVSAGAEFSSRLPAVQRALYLLFNEGYHGASPESVVRADLCHEAIRLTAILLQHPLGATPATYALAALMHLDAARLPTRTDSSGKLSSLFDQDRSQWDSRLIAEGQRLLDLSATGQDLSEYHLEAAIAWVHSAAGKTEDTNWGHIVSLYDKLMMIRHSPVVALNRAIALGQLEGPARGLEEILAIANRDRLTAYPFYFAALGEFQFRTGSYDLAREQFLKARDLARNPMERNFLEARFQACERAAILTPVSAIARK